MKTTAAVLLAVLALTAVYAAGSVQLDVCNVSTGSVTHLTLPASGLSGGFSPVAPGPKVLADPKLYAQARAMFARRAPGVDRPRQSKAAPPALLGTYRALVLLVDFRDHRPENYAGLTGVAHYNDMLFSVGTYPTGSMRDWYKENSYDQFEVDGEASGGPTGWYRAPRLYTYYVGANNGTGAYPNNAQRLVQELVLLADPLVDFSLYDNDHDGSVESLFVVHSGPGAEATGSRDDIWSHMWSLDGLPNGGAPEVDGVRVSSYSIEPEDGKIGVFCHEYGHILGANDFYDYGHDVAGYDSAGLGVWSVMAGGSWGADYNSDDRPAHFDPFHKIQFGWIKPTVLEAAQTGVSLPDVETHPTVYKLWKNGHPGTEYFLVENRQKLGFDALLYGSGLLIYHVDETKLNTTVNDQEWYPGTNRARHYAVALQQADARWDLEHNFNVGDAGDPFPGTANNRSFAYDSTPDSASYLFGPSGVQITGISDSLGTMTADLAVTTPAHVTWYARADAVGLGNGATPETAFATVNQALSAARSGDTILVAPGVYTERLDFVGKRVTVTGSNPSAPSVVAATIIRGPTGGATVRFATAETGASILRGLTITHLPGANGSGVYIAGASPRLEDCVIRDNVLDLGGEELCFGAGVHIRDGANPVLLRCTLANNSGDYGGGLCVLLASATLRDSTFANNRATYEGGGVFLRDCGDTVVIDNCRFTGDEAKRGGGLHCTHSSPLVTGCRFDSCVARNTGGAIHLRYGSSARIIQTAIYKCRAFLYSTSGGAGIYCVYSSHAAIDRVTIHGCSSPMGAGLCALSQSQPTLTNSIITNCDGPGVQAESALTVTYSNVWRNHGGDYRGFDSPEGSNGNLSVPAQFVDPVNGDLHLKSRAGHWTPTGFVGDTLDSPCIDAGDPATPVGSEPQPNGGRVNMGSDGGTAQASRTLTDEPATAGYAAVFAAAAPAPNGGAQIMVTLRATADVSVAITNLAGVTIAVLGEKRLPSGVSTLLWDGRGRSGAKAPAGQYLVRVQARQASGAVSNCLTGLRR